MFNPEIEAQTSDEMLDLLEQIDEQKKKRSEAVDRLKACAKQATEKLSDDVKVFTLPTKINGAAPHKIRRLRSETAKLVKEQREQVEESRIARKSGLDVLKQTTDRAVQTIRDFFQAPQVAVENNGNGYHPIEPQDEPQS